MKPYSPKMSFTTESNLSNTLFMQREYSISHLPYDKELVFYDAVKRGDLKKLEKIMLSLDNEKLGKLSNSPLNNQKYHLIITIALITRFCIEGGMPNETAYTLSDLYIRQLDLCKSVNEVQQIHRRVTFDFAKRMKAIQEKPLLSKATIRALDYISLHLQDKITLDDISNEVGLNKTYFCKLFKQEMGHSISQYIMKQKIEASANLLLYTDYSEITLCNYFGFSSLSHFINVFKKCTGLTPKEYRKSNYRNYFNASQKTKLHKENIRINNTITKKNANMDVT